MGDFDLAPPPMPGEHIEEKKGFLKKLFSKKEKVFFILTLFLSASFKRQSIIV